MAKAKFRFVFSPRGEYNFPQDHSHDTALMGELSDKAQARGLTAEKLDAMLQAH